MAKKSNTEKEITGTAPRVVPLDIDALEEAFELAQAIRGKGAFRRFREIVFGPGEVELKYAWDWFETSRKREQIVAWLASCRIEPVSISVGSANGKSASRQSGKVARPGIAGAASSFATTCRMSRSTRNCWPNHLSTFGRIRSSAGICPRMCDGS